ncbi:MAG: hypothetical protein AMJ46_07680 [Latescibacteria bacterium DG_63]|uniref:Uncharacterized protein n=2 Tax=Bacteria division TA06 TaxID=1156500 RepID=A0A0S8JPR9_UNCT6|nr:MAG: hypothetical protein AMJ46_07680 [Latescibacteria bacterium DG_63]KPK69527.1 MAG: hypothetical protein AMJ82_05240 [candidate division TA06 bacterium SM23_40]KPL10780.1 MAG: hypothetical protein AMJ71_01930 [candidate division TA06 bacterium SM1_40]
MRGPSACRWCIRDSNTDRPQPAGSPRDEDTGSPSLISPPSGRHPALTRAISRSIVDLSGSAWRCAPRHCAVPTSPDDASRPVCPRPLESLPQSKPNTEGRFCQYKYMPPRGMEERRRHRKRPRRRTHRSPEK